MYFTLAEDEREVGVWRRQGVVLEDKDIGGEEIQVSEVDRGRRKPGQRAVQGADQGIGEVEVTSPELGLSQSRGGQYWVVDKLNGRVTEGEIERR